MYKSLANGLLTLVPLLALPSLALADEHCKFSEPRTLDLQLAGAKAVVFEVAQHDLRLQATPGTAAHLQGRACASSADALGQLTLTQQRSGDKLVVTLKREGRNFSFGNSYAYLDIAGSVPDDVMVQLKVGSGDAEVSGASALSADIGSGDVKARAIKGQLTASVGSGDLEIDGAGALHVLSVGSGDVKAERIGGAARVGSVGSGDLELRQVRGDVRIDSIGSGDVELTDIGGDVALGSIGSGDLSVRNVQGGLKVATRGSGDISHRDVRGTVDVPKAK